MTRIFEPIVLEVEKLGSDQVMRVKLEKTMAGKPPLVRVSINPPREEDRRCE